MKIKAGFGYWDVSRFPIGGDFCRAPDSGVDVAEIIEEFKPYKGCNIKVRLGDGRKACLSKQHLEV